tara:strand:+ start:1620 stop:2423 length:804 start_codon:yes stop_codon:yes gene_type:complete
MNVSGNLRKMRTSFQSGNEVQYFLNTEDGEINLNDFIEKPFTMHFEGRINCVACGRLTSKAFGQGFCYPCFKNSPMNSECIIRPELCEAHLGKGRDVEWEKKNHLQPHVVYLAASSGVKVGVTRNDQIPTRWIDQGASRALVLAETEYRQQAGLIEVALKDFISDKTNWQRMLKNEQTDADLFDLRDEMANNLPTELQSFVAQNAQEWEIKYPVVAYPTKVKSINLTKTPDVTATLLGIKGQYLIFDNNQVFNVRNNSGLFVDLKLA